MADEPGGSGEEQGGAGVPRGEASRPQAYKLFLKEFQATVGLPGEQAEKVLVPVLCALEQWLVQGEVDDPRMRLPMKLQEALQVCAPRREPSPWAHGVDEFLQKIADTLGGDTAQAESVTRRALSTVRSHITESEAEQVGEVLPLNLRVFWARAL